MPSEKKWKIKAERHAQERGLIYWHVQYANEITLKLNCIIYVHNNSIIITGLKLNYTVISISK